ncbi:hypothetical protein QWY31_15845 [Cytophagales bacterium LB-30]|uniref:Uncharacterized protein n=1 Tax=Shiella aurantiaca TaxID=3058365 RepID=A0ABT8F9E5_9BACT|nr:hypothetical protein [Shiella aurantiaca]MDN4166984.1 hypothetical protein [Shiella aurantiaca]
MANEKPIGYIKAKGGFLVYICEREDVLKEVVLKSRKIGGNILLIEDEEYLPMGCYRVRTAVYRSDLYDSLVAIQIQKEKQKQDSIETARNQFIEEYKDRDAEITLYIFRDDFVGSALPYYLEIGDQIIGSAPVGFRRKVYLSRAGLTEIYISGTSSETEEMLFLPKQTYYLELKLGFMGVPIIKMVDNKEGAKVFGHVIK